MHIMWCSVCVSSPIRAVGTGSPLVYVLNHIGTSWIGYKRLGQVNSLIYRSLRARTMVRAPLCKCGALGASTSGSSGGHVTPLFNARVPLPVDPTWPPAHVAPPGLLKLRKGSPSSLQEARKPLRPARNRPQMAVPTRRARLPRGTFSVFSTHRMH